MLTNLGLGIIIIAWLYQLIVSIEKGNFLSTSFISIYSVGVALLVIGGLSSNDPALSYLNLLSFLSSIAVLLAVKAKGKSQK